MDLLTSQQAGRKLGVSARRVVALIESGKLKAQKIGRDWMIEPGALAAVQDRPPGRPPKATKPRKTR